MGKTFSTGLLTNAIKTDSSNNVGIGTTSPSFATGMGLSIYGGAVQPRISLKNNSTTDGSTRGFQLAVSAPDAIIENREVGDMRFFTTTVAGSSTERMRITSDGNVGIGTSSPARPLHIVGTSGDTYARTSNTAGGAQFGVTSNGDGIFESFTSGKSTLFWTNGSERMRITSGGNVCINTTSTAAQLVVSNTSGDIIRALGNSGVNVLSVDNNGNLKAQFIGTNSGTALVIDSNGFIVKSSSSIRYKKDIEPIDIGLDFVNSLTPVKYNLKSNGEAQIGFIAEDFPDERLVSFSRIDMENENSELQKESVNYSNLTAALVKAIQEQNEIITKQGQAIEELKALIAAK